MPTSGERTVRENSSASGHQAGAVATRRPPLSPQMTTAEFRRWYWTVAELRPFARLLGITSTGVKAELSARIAAKLSGQTSPPSPTRARARLQPPLTEDTVIPEDVVLSRDLRDWFTTQIGPGFHSDQHMRDFMRNGAGRTLGDAVAHWYATRDAPPPVIGAQFELNRFTRAWHAANPGGTAADLKRAWQEYRNTPVDEREVPGRR